MALEFLSPGFFATDDDEESLATLATSLSLSPSSFASSSPGDATTVSSTSDMPSPVAIAVPVVPRVVDDDNGLQWWNLGLGFGGGGGCGCGTWRKISYY